MSVRACVLLSAWIAGPAWAQESEPGAARAEAEAAPLATTATRAAAGPAIAPTAPPAAPAAPPAALAPPDADPVVRSAPGNVGFFFRFGGLSTLSATGNARDINGVIATQVGVRVVRDGGWTFPVYLGSGFRVLAPDNRSSVDVDAGADLGGGVEYHFREWRRISPFVGFGAGAGFSFTQDDEAIVGFGVGPTLGVEYYVADRVSLIAQYSLTLQLEVVPDEYIGFSFATLSGGALTLVFYF